MEPLSSVFRLKFFKVMDVVESEKLTILQFTKKKMLAVNSWLCPLSVMICDTVDQWKLKYIKYQIMYSTVQYVWVTFT